MAWELGKSSPKISPSSFLKSTNSNSKNSKTFDNTQTFTTTTTANDCGFKDFLPYSNNVSNKSDKKQYLNRDFDEEDDDEEMMDEEMLDDDEYDNDADNENDLNELIYVLKEKNKKNSDNEEDIDPIDLLNHETFSDMQSINTEDMSFNAMSLSPPIPLSKFKTTTQSPQNLFLDQSFLLPDQGGFEALMNINEQNQQFYQQFPLLMPASNNQNNYNSHPPNAPNSSLNNSLAYNVGNGGNTMNNIEKPPGYFNAYSSSLFSNPSELSPFNYQTNKFNATYNFYGNNNNNYNSTTSNKDVSNQLHFNDFNQSFDKAESSLYDESLMHKNLNGRENVFYKTHEHDDEFELGYLMNQSWVIKKIFKYFSHCLSQG